MISKLHLKRGEAKFSCKYKESRVLLCIKYFVTHCFGSIQEVILQQDNVPKYSQHFARTILTPKKTTEDFIPQLHDLNPSEYLWGHLINERNRIHSSYRRTYFVFSNCSGMTWIIRLCRVHIRSRTCYH